MSFSNTFLTVGEGIGPVEICVQIALASGRQLDNNFVVDIVSDGGTRAGGCSNLTHIHYVLLAMYHSLSSEPGVDFILPVSPQVLFPAMTSGTSTQCIVLTIVEDDDYEGQQTFSVSFLLETTLPVTISNGVTVITITDNGG